MRRPSLEFGRCRRVLSQCLLFAAAVVPVSSAVHAQQPSLRPAPWSGTVAPPMPIAGLDDARPHMPLEFSRAWLEKMESVRLTREQLAAAGTLDGMTADELARAGGALTGTLNIPVIAIRYMDVIEPFAAADLHERLFGAGTPDTMSFTGYWNEVSGGLLTVGGAVSPWITSRKPARHYLPADQFGWSRFGRVNDLRDEALRAADRFIDFAQFDNDGPDGVPDSGDDDGFVDFIAIAYALPCPGTARAGAIWPHRGTMPPFVTSTIGADGTPILISDYVILPAVDPFSCGPMQIGVLAHETGHALGLPDLYDYDGSSQGIGAWGLMGTGSHAEQHSPAHLGAWEKEQLGWVAVSWLTPEDSTLVVKPVTDDRTVYRVQGDDGSYILLENRRRSGSDRHLPAAGLLVWNIEPERAELGVWNSDERRPAVGLLQADGRNDLGHNRRADAGDPFPGATRQSSLHTTFAGGLQLDSIHETRDVVTARLRIHRTSASLTTDPGVLRLTAVAGSGIVRQTVAVRSGSDSDHDWKPVADASWLTVERDGDRMLLGADPTALVAGTYTDTVDLAVAAADDDGPGTVLARVIVSLYIATPGVGQIIATELPWSWGVAVRGGRILQASYGWDHLGLRPRPRVLQQWEGATHPSTLARIAADALYSPVIDPADGSSFVIAHALDGNYLYQLHGNGNTELIAARVGSEPAYGATVLADGSIAVAEWNGRISLVRRDGSVHDWMHLGVNIYQITSDDDAIYAAMYSGNVLRVGIDGSRTELVTGYRPGELVSVAMAADGSVIAAERGGTGRIMRISQDGSRDVVYHRPGARFYGVAVDDGFVFALDLTHRHLLRIPLPLPADRLFADAVGH